jgi:GH43 family beta-xylosidase
MVCKSLIAGVFLFVVGCKKSPDSGQPPAPAVVDSFFSNPLLPGGPDPWVIQKDTNYYYTNTMGNRVAIYKTSKMSQLAKANAITVWTPPAAGAYSKNIWAPEIHVFNQKWYLYFAADDGDNKNHRIYALENDSPDPLTASWIFKGKIADTLNDKWAIDASAFEYKSQLYFIWSGWQADVDGEQDIYIAKMKDPLTIDGSRVKISSPTYPWEKMGAPPVINEGPEALINSKNQLFITYSASGCWTDDYSLGLLTLDAGGDPMNAADWEKTPTPVFSTVAANSAYAPGHNSFFKSRDGSEDWLLYHANSSASQGCGDSRSPRMQKFTWNTDGSPNFGEPVKININIKKPSGE